MKKFTLILFLFIFCQLTLAQQKIEIGTYIANDKLSYVSIINENQFSFLKYYKWSPYTLKLKNQKQENKSVCGTVGYVSDGKGEGFYKIENGKLKLEFTKSEKGMNNKEITSLTFTISELRKE